MVEEIRAYKTKKGEVCENVEDAVKKENDENRQKFTNEFIIIFNTQYAYISPIKPVMIGIGELIYNHRKEIKTLIDKYL
jgi:hypothetical protein